MLKKGLENNYKDSNRCKHSKYQINALVGSACFLLWHIQANDSKNGWC